MVGVDYFTDMAVLKTPVLLGRPARLSSRQVCAGQMVLAMGKDSEKKTVSLSFLGAGNREVNIGYIQEAPIWKTSYRLVLADDVLVQLLDDLARGHFGHGQFLGF